jgi:hypothetical protein
MALATAMVGAESAISAVVEHRFEWVSLKKIRICLFSIVLVMVTGLRGLWLKLPGVLDSGTRFRVILPILWLIEKSDYKDAM